MSLRESIARLQSTTGIANLSEFFDKSRAGRSLENPDKTAIDDTRKALDNRQKKRAFDKALKDSKPQDRAKESKRNANRDLRRMRKLQRQLEKTHGVGVVPECFPSHLWIQTKLVVSDATNQAGTYYANKSQNKIGIGLLHRAALSPDSDGKNRYTYTGNSRGSVRARSILALGLMMLSLSRPTRRRDRYKRIVKGIPQTLILEALNHPANTKDIHINTLTGKHRESIDNKPTSGDVGWLDALKNIGFLCHWQARWKDTEKPDLKGWHDITANEISPNVKPGGWLVSLNRYWIVTDQYTDPKNAAIRAELMVANMAGNLPEQTMQAPPRTPDGEITPLSLPPPL